MTLKPPSSDDRYATDPSSQAPEWVEKMAMYHQKTQSGCFRLQHTSIDQTTADDPVKNRRGSRTDHKPLDGGVDKSDVGCKPRDSLTLKRQHGRDQPHRARDAARESRPDAGSSEQDRTRRARPLWQRHGGCRRRIIRDRGPVTDDGPAARTAQGRETRAGLLFCREKTEEPWKIWMLNRRGGASQRRRVSSSISGFSASRVELAGEEAKRGSCDVCLARLSCENSRGPLGGGRWAV